MNANNQLFDVVVIGAGQAGLASGWHLKQHGLNFRIFDEQSQPGGGTGVITTIALNCSRQQHIPLFRDFLFLEQQATTLLGMK